MGKTIFIIFLSVFCIAYSYSGTSDEKPIQESREKAKILLLKKTGGFLKVPDSAKGSCLFLNLQSRLCEMQLTEPSSTLSHILQSEIKFESRKAPFKGVSEMKQLISNTGSVGLILIIDNKDFPMSLIAPEENWGIVNISKLSLDGPTTETLGRRARLELWRTFALLFGAGNSMHPGCIMKTVSSVKDLDRFSAQSVCPEPFGKIRMHLGKIGISPYVRTTYRKACEQGWAPMPINSYQRAIWEEINKKKKGSSGICVGGK